MSITKYISANAIALVGFALFTLNLYLDYFQGKPNMPDIDIVGWGILLVAIIPILLVFQLVEDILYKCRTKLLLNFELWSYCRYIYSIFSIWDIGLLLLV